MKWYRIILMIVLALFLFPFTVLAEKADTTGANVIYLLDVSGSMKKGGLFENIKVRLKQLVEERNMGDRIVLITFGEEIWKVIDVEVRNHEDIDDINKVIGNLKAEGPWTWMSKAFQRIKDIAQDIRSKSPEKRLMIYLLTDCINDPPPEVKKTEPPWKFVEVLANYFKDFKVKDTHIYLLSYRPLGQEEKDKIKEQTDIVVKEPEASEPIPSKISEEPSKQELPKQGTDLWKWIVFVIVLLGVILSIIWAIRPPGSKRLWIRMENGEVYEKFIRERQKLWLGKHYTGEYLELGLPTYFLTLGKKASIMLCEEKSGERRRVDFEKEMLCKLEEDKIIKLKFYRSYPKQAIPEGEDEAERSKGPMNEI